jgi:hypothetical protein
VAEHFSLRVRAQQNAELNDQRGELRRGEVVLGTILLIHAADETDAKGAGVEAFNVGTYLVECTTGLQCAITTDDEVVPDLAEAPRTMPTVDDRCVALD